MSMHISLGPAVDGWTFLHILTGINLALFKVPRVIAYTIIFATEIIEAGFRSIGITFFRESPQNIVTDLIASVSGFELAKAVL